MQDTFFIYKSPQKVLITLEIETEEEGTLVEDPSTGEPALYYSKIVKLKEGDDWKVDFDRRWLLQCFMLYCQNIFDEVIIYGSGGRNN